MPMLSKKISAHVETLDELQALVTAAQQQSAPGRALVTVKSDPFYPDQIVIEWSEGDI